MTRSHAQQTVTWTERNLIGDNGIKLLTSYEPANYPQIKCLDPTRIEGCFVIDVQDSGAGLSEVLGYTLYVFDRCSFDMIVNAIFLDRSNCSVYLEKGSNLMRTSCKPV